MTGPTRIETDPPPPFPARTVVGVLLVVLALFMLASPGRLDTIDGQHRFNVALGLLERGRPDTVDTPTFNPIFVGFNGEWHYTAYSAPPSVLGAVGVGLGRLLPGATEDRDGFTFVATSAVLAAGAMLLLLDTLRRLGVAAGAAALTCLLTAGATLLLPYAGSAFDQAQHAAVVLGVMWGTARAARSPDARGWLLPGLFVGLGIAYREVHAVWMLGPLLAAWATSTARGRALVALALGTLPGVAVAIGWNLWRTGSPLPPAMADTGDPLFGNPLVGLAGLLVSPGKGVLWYSPPVLLGLLGLRGLRRRSRPLFLAVVGTAAAHTGLYACLSFYGGDWCWGPRYMLAPATVLMIAAPFAAVPRAVTALVVVAGLAVQGLGLGRDYSVFIYQHRLPFNFQYRPDAYFSRSALLSRPGEIAEMIRSGVPPEAVAFGSSDRPDLLTRAVFYFDPTEGPEPLRSYAVFWLPTPWPVWMRALPSGVPRPVPENTLLVTLGGALVGGLLLLRREVEGGAAPAGSAP